MFEWIVGIAIVGLVVWKYWELHRWNRRRAQDRAEADRLTDCCRTCTDYDCIVTCKAKQLQDAGK